ncbi:EAL and HDOD domain-containing protein [Halorhodospira neutriphila]|uniref:Diguanylate phosphodiesterase n=1 Tax=Halorhodospira neutriphila TaxID=168379 RepID=A0ABS1EC58_9GAMM|nr:EAL domain-containing protein [Halorhodospira neutriphila]MBK1727434.1 hypothetical protein [Halorhodospira neutriphila]
MEICLARQPIFDRRLQVRGYELLYRRNPDSTSAQVLDGDAATSAVILNAFAEIGLQPLTGGQPAYLNLTRPFFTEYSLPFPKDAVVLEVLEDIEPDRPFREALRRLAGQGYRIALDDFILESGIQDRLLPFVDTVKVDLTRLSAQEVTRHAQTLRRHGVRHLLAEKVETQEEMQRCQAAGFDLFQGFFLSRPSTYSRRSIPAHRLPLFRLIAALQRPEIDIAELERLISQDVALSYKLMRYLASPLFPSRNVDSIRSAILYLGSRELARWATLLAMSSSQDQPPERIISLLVRARLCEQLAQEGGLEGMTAFTIGLFSGLDGVLDAPLAVICEELPLSAEARQALLEHRGPYGGLLACALAQEHGEWERIGELGWSQQALTERYLEAIRWADELWAWLRRAAAEREEAHAPGKGRSSRRLPRRSR